MNKVQSIKNYAKEIKNIEKFVDAVRKMPGMYIGRIGNDGFLSMIREIYQNSVDEMEKENSPCTEVTVSYNEDTNEVVVSDNGRGIPFDIIEQVYTKEHTSSNYTKKKFEYSSGRHGVGAKVTNALCSYFTVESYINIPGQCEGRKAEFNKGIMTKKGVYKIDNKDKLQGTIVRFFVDYDIMGKITLTSEEVFNLLTDILFLTKKGSIINFISIKDNKDKMIRVVNDDGIETILNRMSNHYILNNNISAFDDNGENRANITFNFTTDEPSVIGYANYCPTIEESTHIKGFREGAEKFFKDYMNKIYLKDSNSKRKNKITISNVDIRSCLNGVVSVSHLEPIFTGQAKEILSNEDIKGFVKNLMLNRLEEWSKMNASEFNKVCKHIKSLAEIRLSSESDKVKLSNSYSSSSISKGMPDKYKPANGNKHLELIFVEGDSAAGSYSNARCNERQAILPIGGKIPNAFDSTRNKILSNSETASMLKVIGGGAGTKKFDVSKVKWDKVIIAADADVDGGHITCLVLMTILEFCPELIEAGLLFKANPPLYGIPQNNKKMRYIANENDYITYLTSLFIKNNDVYDLNKNKLNKTALNELMKKNIDYSTDLKNIADSKALNPELLEAVCLEYLKYNGKFKKSDVSKIQNELRKQFRFINVELVDDILHVYGLYKSTTNNIYMNSNTINDLYRILNTLSNNSQYYILNKEKVTLYGLMKIFDKSKPKRRNRYKGLGEMNPLQLAESTLYPDSDRVLIQYTMDSAREDIEKIRYFEQNKKELIKDVKVTKQDLM